MKQYKGTGMISPVFSFKMFHSTMRILLRFFLEYLQVHNMFSCYNGRAVIGIKMNNGKSVISAKVDNMATAFINL